MGHEVAKTVVDAGLVDDETCEELAKWGAPVPAKNGDIPLEKAPAAIEKAMQEEDFVKVRETDLELLRYYLQHQHSGRLVLQVPGDIETVAVSYCKTVLGEYVIPFIEEGDISDILTNGETHLLTGDEKVYFKDVRTLHFGDKQAFIVCIPEK